MSSCVRSLDDEFEWAQYDLDWSIALHGAEPTLRTLFARPGGSISTAFSGFCSDRVAHNILDLEVAHHHLGMSTLVEIMSACASPS